LTDEEIEGILRSHLLKLKKIFEDAHWDSFDHSQEELDWHGTHNDAYYLANDGYLREDPCDTDPFSVFDKCLGKSALTKRKQKTEGQKKKRV